MIDSARSTPDSTDREKVDVPQETPSDTVHAASAIITSPLDDRVFVAQRSRTKRFSPGEWEMIGGGMELDETPEECIRREINEELRVEAATVERFRDYTLDGVRFRVFVVTLDGVPNPNADDFES